jgi:hypothetical protein
MLHSLQAMPLQDLSTLNRGNLEKKGEWGHPMPRQGGAAPWNPALGTTPLRTLTSPNSPQLGTNLEPCLRDYAPKNPFY